METESIQIAPKEKVKIKVIRIPIKPAFDSDKKPEGGQTKFKPDVVKKLEDAFSIGATIAEACIHAEITKQTYYNWIEDKPELLDYFKQLREKPVLKARNNIALLIQKGDGETSKWYLERKKRDEFSTRTEHTGKDGEGIQIEVVNYQPNENSNTIQLRPNSPALPAGSPAESGEVQVTDYSPESGQDGVGSKQADHREPAAP